MDRSPGASGTVPSRHTWNAATSQPVRTVDGARFDAMFEGMGSARSNQQGNTPLYSSQTGPSVGPAPPRITATNGRPLYSTHDGVMDSGQSEAYLHPDTLEPMNPPVSSARASGARISDMGILMEVPDGKSWPMGMIIGNSGEILKVLEGMPASHPQLLWESSPGAWKGRIEEGDKIIELSGQPVQHLQHKADFALALKQASSEADSVRLSLLRRKELDPFGLGVNQEQFILLLHNPSAPRQDFQVSTTTGATRPVQTVSIYESREKSRVEVEPRRESDGGQRAERVERVERVEVTAREREAEYERKVRDVEEQNRSLREENQRLKAAKKEVEELLADTESKLAKLPLEQARSSQQHGMLQQKEAELKGLLASNKDLSRKLQTAESQMRELEEINEEMSKTNRTLIQKCSAAELKSQQVERQSRHGETESKDLQRQVERVEGRNRELEQEVQELKQKRAQEQAQLEAASRQASRVQGDMQLIRELQGKLESASQLRQEAEDERDALQAEISRLRGRPPPAPARREAELPGWKEGLEGRGGEGGGRLERFSPPETERKALPAVSRAAPATNELEEFLQRPIDEFLPRKGGHSVAFQQPPRDLAPPADDPRTARAISDGHAGMMAGGQAGSGGSDGGATPSRIAELQARAQQLDRELSALGPREPPRPVVNDDIDDFDDRWRGRGDDDEEEEDSEGSDYDYLLREDKSRAAAGGLPAPNKGGGAQALYEDVM